MNKLIGGNLREQRIKKNYTQEYMAGRLHMSIASYSNIENGKVSLTLDMLLEICAVLKIEDWKEVLPPPSKLNIG